jgi:hypothetical protein
MTSSFTLLIHAIFYLIIIIPLFSAQDDSGAVDSDVVDGGAVDSGNATCSFINGQSCLNGICKYCALCTNSACVLSTPYTTTNDLSCAAANGTDGYNFYNYCISKGQDDDGGKCFTYLLQPLPSFFFCLLIVSIQIIAYQVHSVINLNNQMQRLINGRVSYVTTAVH